ncbi:MAG TPA: T9SS type A sorting domain-containing protein [Bacteroidia bacterium]|jgi:hypothetical protein
MKKIYVAVLLNSLFINLDAQNFDWAKCEGKYAYDYGYGISTDVSGNVYVAGKYEEDGAFFSGTTVPCAGNHDMFLAKYTSSGNLVWIRTAGGVLGDYAHAMVTDHTNFIYVAGELEGSGDVVSFSNSSVTLNTNGDNDIFVAKYDMNGNLLWAKSAGGGGGEKALGVSYDNAGNVYICGNYKTSFVYEGVPLTAVSPGERDIFVAKYDANGNFQWVKSAGGPGREEALSIECTGAGEVYVCGMYSNGAVWGSQTYNTPATPTGTYLNGFLSKYATDGTLLWVKPIGGDYDDVAWDLTIDNGGKIIVTGEYHANVMFDAIQLTTVASADIFVASYDGSGNVAWAKSAGGTLSDRARGIGTDGSKIFITGQFGSEPGTPAMFGTNSLLAVDSSDVFMAGMDNNGNFLWVKGVTGPVDAFEPLGYESGNAICAHDANTIYATGAILDGGTFGVFALDDYSRTDAFIAKINMLVGVDETAGASALKIYPNPATGVFSIDVTDLQNERMELSVYNYLGELIERKAPTSNTTLNVDISTQNKGVYFVEIKTENKIFRDKIILQ